MSPRRTSGEGMVSAYICSLSLSHTSLKPPKRGVVRPSFPLECNRAPRNSIPISSSERSKEVRSGVVISTRGRRGGKGREWQCDRCRCAGLARRMKEFGRGSWRLGGARLDGVEEEGGGRGVARPVSGMRRLLARVGSLWRDGRGSVCGCEVWVHGAMVEVYEGEFGRKGLGEAC